MNLVLVFTGRNCWAVFGSTTKSTNAIFQHDRVSETARVSFQYHFYVIVIVSIFEYYYACLSVYKRVLCRQKIFCVLQKMPLCMSTSWWLSTTVHMTENTAYRVDQKTTLLCLPIRSFTMNEAICMILAHFSAMLFLNMPVFTFVNCFIQSGATWWNTTHFTLLKVCFLKPSDFVTLVQILWKIDCTGIIFSF